MARKRVGKMKKKLREVRKCKTTGDLELLGIGRLVGDGPGYRGGTLGFCGSDVAAYVGCDEADLPGKVGCYCNYLGGGVRGSVVGGGYSSNVTGSKAELLDALAEACKRAYVNAENGLNDETDGDGDTNWDALATKGARAAGVVSAY